jgi:anthranilate phosphoribosyltransferase
MGYKFKNDIDRLKKEIDEANICFLHAPLFPPALKTVGPIRKNLAMRLFSICLAHGESFTSEIPVGGCVQS